MSSHGTPRLKHGYVGRSEYNAWHDIKRRTLNPNYYQAQYYIARGITICDRWKNSFPNFIKDVGDKPTPKHSIDRIDNNGNYSCGKCKECLENGWLMNVKWSTPREQVINRGLQKNIKLGWKGVRKTKFNTYTAHITVNRKYTHIGNYKTLEEAAKAYNKRALEIFGDKVLLN